jgi:hypothetical protein
VYISGCGGGEAGEAATNGGNAAASAAKFPLIIPTGATTMGITIGAGGVAPAGAGGNTDIAVGGTDYLRLAGGPTSQPQFWTGSTWRALIPTDDVSRFAAAGLMQGAANSSASGGPSLYGAGGATGNPGLGYGAGGGVNGDGSDGFVMLEFVEGV